jgi:protein gp37
MAETKIEWCDFTFNPWIGCEGRGAGVRQATGGATSRESSAAACSSPRIIKTSEAVE